MNEWKHVRGKNSKGVNQECYISENKMITKTNSYHFGDKERWKAGAMQSGTDPLDLLYDDTTSSGIPVSYHPTLKDAKGQTPAQKSIRAHIREYIEKRGGVETLSENEKETLAKLATQ